MKRIKPGDTTSITITPQAQKLLADVNLRFQQEAEIDKLSKKESMTFINCLVKLLAMGGHIHKESDTMLISYTESEMTIGMHFDGESWSLNS